MVEGCLTNISEIQFSKKKNNDFEEILQFDNIYKNDENSLSTFLLARNLPAVALNCTCDYGKQNAFW